MIPDDGTWIDSLLLERLLAEDAARIAGGDLEGATTSSMAVDHGLRDCLQRLAEVWPNPEALPAPEGPWMLGRFEVLHAVGRGGFGIVYRARDRTLGRDVALKVPSPEVLLSAALRRRFLREARAVGQLDHPNIVPLHEAGEEGALCYIASAYCEGPTLSTWLKGRDGPVPARLAARLVQAIASAVQHAHERGVLHRDLKPSNVLLQHDGDDDDAIVPRITDFGLARLADEPGDETRTGVPMGSPPYMSPEQAEGRHRDVGPATDVYGLGTILYELLTGRAPFRGETSMETIRHVIEVEPIALRALRHGLPRDLETIVLTCLAKAPGRRYRSASALGEDLRRFLAGEPIRARPVSAWERGLKWARRRPVHAALAVLLALIAVSVPVGLASWNVWLRSYSRRLTQEIARADLHARVASRHLYAAELRLARQAIELGRIERAQDILDKVGPGPDGIDPRGFAWHYLRRVARREIILLRGHEQDVVAFDVAPDGRSLASVDKDGVLLLHDLPAGRPRVLSRDASHRVAFAPTGRLLAAHLGRGPGVPHGGIALWDTATGRSLGRLIADRDLLGDFSFLAGGDLIGARAIDPEGRVTVLVWDLSRDLAHPRELVRVGGLESTSFAASGTVFAARSGDRVTIRDARTGAVRNTLPLRGRFHPIALAPDGRALAVTLPDHQVLLADVATGAEQARIVLRAPLERLEFGHNGGALVTLGADGVVTVLDRATGRSVALRPEERERKRRSVQFALAPDGKTLALCSYGIPGGQSPVTLHEVPEGRKVGVFPGQLDLVKNLAFGADGRALYLDGGTSIRFWRPGGHESAEPPLGHLDEAWAVAFSPDGRTLASGSDDTRSSATLKLWDAATGRQRSAFPAHPGTVAALAFARDGRTLASAGLCDSDNLRLWDPADGRRLATLAGHTGRVRSVAFSLDGRTLASGGSDRTLRLWDLASRRCRAVLTDHGDAIRQVAFSPDGRTLASAGNDATVRLWDPASARLVRILRAAEKVAAIAFSADGTSLAVADEDGLITLWDPATGTPRRTLHDEGELRRLAFSSDGRTLAAAGMSRDVRLWDATTGQELLVLPGHQAQVNGLAFAPDGSILASCSHDGEVRLWRGWER